MISNNGVKFKVVIRNFTDSAITLEALDSNPFQVRHPIVYESVTNRLTYNKLRRLKDTLMYNQTDSTTVIVEVPPKSLIVINGLLPMSNAHDEDRSLNILVGNDSLARKMLLRDLFNANSLFKPVGSIFTGSVMSFDIYN